MEGDVIDRFGMGFPSEEGDVEGIGADHAAAREVEALAQVEGLDPPAGALARIADGETEVPDGAEFDGHVCLLADPAASAGSAVAPLSRVEASTASLTTLSDERPRCTRRCRLGCPRTLDRAGWRS